MSGDSGLRSIVLRGVAIQLGLACPLRCRHCYVSAGPQYKHVLPNEYIHKIIEGFACANTGTRVLALTGGEPFLMREALRFATELALSNNLEVYINTSAYFAKTVETAHLVLEDFAHIHRIEISADAEHEEFIPLGHAVNCAIAAHELGIPVQFAVQREEWENRGQLYEILSALSWATVYKQTFSPVGERNEDRSSPYRMPSVMIGGCGKVGTLLFDEHGDAHPCCSSVAMARRGNSGGKLSRFSLGSIVTDSFEEILYRLLTRHSLKLIKTIGPSTLAAIVDGGDLPFKCRTYCDTCIDLHEADKFRPLSHGRAAMLVSLATSLGVNRVEGGQAAKKSR